MTTEQFAEIWQGWYLRQYLVDTCKACTHSIELQEDCLQEAALAILGEETGQRTMEWYADEGRRAIVKCRNEFDRHRRGKAIVLRKYKSYMRRSMNM